MINAKFKVDVRYGEKNPDTKEITWKSNKSHNLINTTGLGMLADYWTCQCTENVYLESGGRVNARYSGATLVEQSGTTITADNPFFLNDASDADQVRLIVWDDGTTNVITGYTDVDEVEALNSQNVVAQPCTVYYTEETQMDGFVKASTTYDTSGGANTNSWNVAADVLTIENKRTIEFPVEPSDITYKGVGWTPLSGDNAIVFGRKVMDIAITASTQPVIEVTISREIDVSTIIKASPINGVAVDATTMNLMGSASYSGVAYYSSINTSTGATVAPTVTSTFLECKVDEDLGIAIGEYAGALDLVNIDMTGDAYVVKSITPAHTVGTFIANYNVTFNRTDLETTDLVTIAAVNNIDDTEMFWRYKLDTSINFVSKRLQGLQFRKTWGRQF